MPIIVPSDGYVTVQDVQDLYEKTLDADAQARVTVWLNYAEKRLRSKVANLDAKVADGTIDADDVKLAIINAVLRIIRNPDGYQSEQGGDYGYSLRRDVASGSLFFTAEDLAPLGITGVRRAGTIGVGIPAHRMSR